jgi:hypothetical protein
MAEHALPFRDFPDDAAVWVFTADRRLSPETGQALLGSIRSFRASWTSHERPVVSEAVLLEDRFLVVAAHIPGGDISGCGIDKLAHAAQHASVALDFSWLGGLDVVFRNPTGDIVHLSRSEFRHLVSTGDAVAETRVFDISPSNLGTYRAQGIERRAGDSWHAGVFGLNALTNA